MEQNSLIVALEGGLAGKGSIHLERASIRISK